MEDDPDTRRMLRSIAESMGLETDEATNRTDGLAMLADDREIGVVLLDLGLPPAENDFSEGIAFLKQGKRRSALTQFIVLTGQSNPQASLQAIEFGAIDFLMKPLVTAQLRFAMERALLYRQRLLQLFRNDKLPLHVVADIASDHTSKDLRGQSMELLLRTVLTETGHNVSESARRLNITREHMYYYITKFRIAR